MYTKPKSVIDEADRQTPWNTGHSALLHMKDSCECYIIPTPPENISVIRFYRKQLYKSYLCISIACGVAAILV